MQAGFFDGAEIIYAYTREQAIADGVLVDVTHWASSETGFLGGFTCPVALTANLWAAVEAIPGELAGIADVRGRAHDVLWMASLALRGALRRREDRTPFDVILPCGGRPGREQRLYAVADGDGVTIGFPEDF